MFAALKAFFAAVGSVLLNVIDPFDTLGRHNE